jgi:hypothetical protein
MIYRVGRVRLKTEETYHGFGIMCVDCGLWTVDTTDSCISKGIGIGIGIVTNMKQEKIYIMIPIENNLLKMPL